ncbi:MAG: phage virion morphogenesis protein [Prosthecobacter sp.]|nr:phage virion morphogenesis protein [Prosthecobacter sp.]
MKISLTKIKNVISPDLKKKLATAKNPKKAMEAAGLAVVSMAQRAFTQPSLRPLSWPGLKPATIKAKQNNGYGTKPLVSSGTLAQSPRIIRVTSKTVTVGSDRKVGGHSLAAIHQMGTKDGKIPARPFFPFSKSGKPTDRASKNIVSAIKRSLDNEIKKP